MNACRARICSSTSSDRVPSAARPKDRRRDRGSQISLVQDRGQPRSSLFRVRLLSYLPILCIRVHTCLHVVGHERADKPEHWRGARAKAATMGEPGEDDDQRRHTPGRGGGSRRPCVTTWPPSAPRAASTDRAPAARRVARRPEGRAATADARAGREAVGQAEEPDKIGPAPFALRDGGPPLLGRDGEERAGSGS